MSIRTILAVGAAKAALLASRIAGRQGSSLPGRIALKIDPGIIKRLSGQVRGRIIVTCGTNGKTTTNNLLCEMLQAQGYKVVCNRTGANMLEGVAAAFLASADSRGRLDADFACLEIDEASARHVFRYLRPDLMILTNLFRDQLDRYGEIDLTMGALQEAIRMAPSVKLVINGDDPLTAYLAEKSGNSYVCFGVSERCADPQGAAGAVREGSFCEYCGSLLQYDFFHFSQLGVYHCPSCGFKRPKIRYDASGVRAGGGLSFAVNGQNIETDRFNEVLRGYKTQFGRGETFEIGRTRVLLNLAKNPAGFDQNISAVLEDRTPKDLIIAINDNAQDGRDISWLWDVDFDRLGDETVRSITVGGTRALDMRLRLKYAGLQAETADEAASARKASVKARERDPEAALEAAIEGKLEDGCGNLYVLVNYTALYKAHEFFRKNG